MLEKLLTTYEPLSIYDNDLDSRWFYITRYFSTYFRQYRHDYHVHQEIEVQYVTKGQCIMHLKDDELTLHESDYIFIDSMVPHYTSVDKGDFCHILNFEAGLTEQSNFIRLASLSDSESFRNFRKTGLPAYMCRDEDNIFRNGIFGLHRLLQQDAPSIEIDMQLSLLFLEMSRQFFNTRKKRSGGVPRYIRSAIDFIAQNFDQEISADDVAAAVDVSKFHLQREFRKATNMTIVDMINHYRIKKAKSLLETSTFSIIDIAHEVGLNSRQYFTDLFTKTTGYTPMQYRKNWGQDFRAEAPGYIDINHIDIQAPFEHHLNSQVQTVTIQLNEDACKEIHNTSRAGLLIKRVDENGNPVAGATFELRRGSGEVLMREVSDLNGIIFRGYFAADTYVVEEIKAPEGYLLADNPIQSRYISNADDNKDFTLTFVSKQAHR
ncbi:MAG: helix-turn-helix domain-containing protein [Oscillospiraceae bacterium]|nr:helix-turn-helix domain-containing protein [Oscillospiraceae bacterium]